MVIQYAAKLVVPLLHMRARLQQRFGTRKIPTSSLAVSIEKLGSVVGDSRMLWRIWGLLPIVQWLTSLEKTQPPTRKILTLERLQAWSMLAYYPSEHMYYLASHGIISISTRRLTKIAIWSCRFWAAYVVLQFFHLREDRNLLKQREKALKSISLEKEEVADIQKRKGAIWNEFWVNVGYLPLTLHWSLESGLYRNEAWTGFFGLIAALASFRGGWAATAQVAAPFQD